MKTVEDVYFAHPKNHLKTQEKPPKNTFLQLNT